MLNLTRDSGSSLGVATPLTLSLFHPHRPNISLIRLLLSYNNLVVSHRHSFLGPPLAVLSR